MEEVAITSNALSSKPPAVRNKPAFWRRIQIGGWRPFEEQRMGSTDINVVRGVIELRKEFRWGDDQRTDREQKIKEIVDRRFPGSDYSIKLTRALFALWANDYDSHMSEHEKAIDLLVQKAVHLNTMTEYPIFGDSILEMTCGTGALIDLLCRRLPREQVGRLGFTANDLTPEMLQKIDIRVRRLPKKRRPASITFTDHDIRTEFPVKPHKTTVFSQTLHLTTDPAIMEFEKDGNFSRGNEHLHIKKHVIKQAFLNLEANGHFILIDEWDPLLSVIPGGMSGELTDLFTRIFKPVKSRQTFREDIMASTKGARIVFEGKAKIDHRHNMYILIYRKDADKIECRGNYTDSSMGRQRRDAAEKVIEALSGTDRMFIQSFSSRNGGVKFMPFEPKNSLRITRDGDGALVINGDLEETKYDSVVFDQVMHDMEWGDREQLVRAAIDSLNLGGSLLVVDHWNKKGNRLGRRELRGMMKTDYEREMMFEATYREPIAKGYDDGIYGFMYRKVAERNHLNAA